jgi:hypothetical protein
METRQRSRRLHSRTDVSWTAWVRSGSQRLRCHTVDLSPHGAKLKPRGEILPGTAVEVLLHPPEGGTLRVSGVVWRVDADGMAVMFLRSIPVQVTDGKRVAEMGRRGWR